MPDRTAPHRTAHFVFDARGSSHDGPHRPLRYHFSGEAALPAAGIYHVENPTDTLALVADTTVTVQGDSLLRAVEMPLNSVVLIQIYP